MIDVRIVPDEREEITTGEAVAGMIINFIDSDMFFLLDTCMWQE